MTTQSQVTDEAFDRARNAYLTIESSGNFSLAGLRAALEAAPLLTAPLEAEVERLKAKAAERREQAARYQRDIMKMVTHCEERDAHIAALTAPPSEAEADAAIVVFGEFEDCSVPSMREALSQFLSNRTKGGEAHNSECRNDGRNPSQSGSQGNSAAAHIAQPPVEDAGGEGRDLRARFTIDHGVIHDSVTGKHVRTCDCVAPAEDGIQAALELMNSLGSGAKTKLLFSADWLRKKIATSPDADYEAGHPFPSPPPPSPVAEGRVPDRETAWLVERRVTPPQYASSDSVWPSLSLDPWRAVRFITEKAAWDFRLRIATTDLRNECAVVEHVFINKVAPPSPVAGGGEKKPALPSLGCREVRWKITVQLPGSTGYWESHDSPTSIPAPYKTALQELSSSSPPVAMPEWGNLTEEKKLAITAAVNIGKALKYKAHEFYEAIRALTPAGAE